MCIRDRLCSRYLKVTEKGQHHGKLYQVIGAFFDRVDAFYRHALEWALAHRWKVVLLTVLTVASSGFFFSHLGKAFAPEQDEGRFLVYLRTPLGSSIDYTDTRLRMIEAIMKRHAEVVTEFAFFGLGSSGQVKQGTLVVRMAPREERRLSQQELLPIIRK